MSDSIIARFPPSDGREWDCQCARCGSSCTHVECDSCDDGYTAPGELYDEDPLWYDQGDTEPCRVCLGGGGWYACMSDPKWCDEHPLEDRKSVRPGVVEWFTHEPKRSEAP